MILDQLMGDSDPQPRLLWKAFQQAKGITVDGVVGKVTWINIDEADQSEPVLNLARRVSLYVARRNG